MMLNDALDEIVSRLDAGTTGLHVTRDPGTLQPPCVLVDVPTITSATMRGYQVTLPVRLIVPGPGNLKAAEQLLDLLPDLLNVLQEDNATPGSYSPNPDVPGLPCMTVTTTVTIERE
jgi:hypothetical protein